MKKIKVVIYSFAAAAILLTFLPTQSLAKHDDQLPPANSFNPNNKTILMFMNE